MSSGGTEGGEPVFKRKELNLDSDSDSDEDQPGELDAGDQAMGDVGDDEGFEDDGGVHPPHADEKALEELIFSTRNDTASVVEGEDILLAQLLALYDSRKPRCRGKDWKKLCEKMRKARERLLEVKKGAPPSTEVRCSPSRFSSLSPTDNLQPIARTRSGTLRHGRAHARAHGRTQCIAVPHRLGCRRGER